MCVFMSCLHVCLCEAVRSPGTELQTGVRCHMGAKIGIDGGSIELNERGDGPLYIEAELSFNLNNWRVEVASSQWRLLTLAQWARGFYR